METIPSSRILDRELSLASTKELRDVGRPALRELVDESIRVFERCSATATGNDEHIGLLFPYLHLAETLDAVEICLDGASTLGANIILRPSFEAWLSVEWVARDKDLRYGAAYVVADIHRRIDEYQRYSAGHPKQKQLTAAMKSDEMGKHIQLPTSDDAVEKISGLEELLNAPHLRKAAAEYDRTRSKNAKKRTPPFYGLWDGPQSLSQLASKLGRAGFYEILYRSWSRSTHAVDVVRQLGHKDGAPAVRAFRSGDGLTQGYVFALSFGLSAMRTVLGFYRPGELTGSYADWYKNRISQPLKSLTEAQ